MRRWSKLLLYVVTCTIQFPRCAGSKSLTNTFPSSSPVTSISRSAATHPIDRLCSRTEPPRWLGTRPRVQLPDGQVTQLRRHAFRLRRRESRRPIRRRRRRRRRLFANAAAADATPPESASADSNRRIPAASVLRARPSVDLATAEAAPRPPLHAVCAHLAATFINSEDSRRWYPLTPPGRQLDGDDPRRRRSSNRSTNCSTTGFRFDSERAAIRDFPRPRSI